MSDAMMWAYAVVLVVVTVGPAWWLVRATGQSEK